MFRTEYNIKIRKFLVRVKFMQYLQLCVLHQIVMFHKLLMFVMESKDRVLLCL